MFLISSVVSIKNSYFHSSILFIMACTSRPEDVSVVCQKFVSHAIGTDTVKEAPTMNAAFTKDLLWTDARYKVFLKTLLQTHFSHLVLYLENKNLFPFSTPFWLRNLS